MKKLFILVLVTGLAWSSYGQEEKDEAPAKKGFKKEKITSKPLETLESLETLGKRRENFLFS